MENLTKVTEISLDANLDFFLYIFLFEQDSL